MRLFTESKSAKFWASIAGGLVLTSSRNLFIYTFWTESFFHRRPLIRPIEVRSILVAIDDARLALESVMNRIEEINRIRRRRLISADAHDGNHQDQRTTDDNETIDSVDDGGSELCAAASLMGARFVAAVNRAAQLSLGNANHAIGGSDESGTLSD